MIIGGQLARARYLRQHYARFRYEICKFEISLFLPRAAPMEKKTHQSDASDRVSMEQSIIRNNYEEYRISYGRYWVASETQITTITTPNHLIK